ncbi:hydrolase 2, exosortase A system-associated [Massilia sp. NR 4-1]|uniref:hydrolase 2, exosortase A system-associated n=1 Tax=Massilia sp. NR 4-1 TaxID=1678028 RepID=UPI0009E2CE1D|nr:hydrolase 2, exosortase A system-associated [Massilia sp. NR 4-1]
MNHHPAPPHAEPFFLKAGTGARFCVFHAAAGACRGAFLYVHPFAEEMNKARRMAALQARAMAAQGYAVLQIDLYGCGDSSGDFADARWEIWLDDLAHGAQWLRERLGGALEQEIGLWGLRLGALLALDYGRQAAQPPSVLLLWQAVTNGANFMTQFLRLKLANQMLAEGQEKNGGTAALRATLAAGEPLEIAGYTLAPALAQSIEALDAAKFAPPPCPLHWFEIVAEEGRPLPPAAARVLQGWQEGGELSAVTVAGQPFWATQEISECPALLDATIAALKEACHAA